MFGFWCPRALLRAEGVLERKGKNLNLISELFLGILLLSALKQMGSGGNT